LISEVLNNQYCWRLEENIQGLLWKNWILTKRSPRSVALISPFMFVLFLFLIEQAVVEELLKDSLQ